MDDQQSSSDSARPSSALPAYQARLLDPKSPSRSGSSLSLRNSFFSQSPTKTDLSSTARFGSPVPLSPSTVRLNTFTIGGNTEREGIRSMHRSGSKSMDATRGFWVDQEKAAASEAREFDQQAAQLKGNLHGLGLSRKPSFIRSQQTGNSESNASLSSRQQALESHPADSFIVSTPPSPSSLSNNHRSRFESTSSSSRSDSARPDSPQYIRSGSPALSSSTQHIPSTATSNSPAHTTRKLHRRANSAQPFTFQPSNPSASAMSPSPSSFAIASSNKVPVLTRQLTGDSESRFFSPTLAASATSPLTSRAHSFDASASNPTETSDLTTSNSNISSTSISKGARTRPHSFHQDLSAPLQSSSFGLSSPSVESPSILPPTTNSYSTMPVLRSSYARAKTSSQTSLHSTFVTSRPESPSIEQPVIPASPIIPSIREPLGPRRGPASRLGRHMPRIASGDAFGSDDQQGNETEEAVPRNRDTLKVDTPKRSQWADKDVGSIRSVGEGDEVIGMKGRRRLPLTSSLLNSGSTYSLRISTATIERTRKEVIAEEYLTRVGEALQWVEGVLQKDLGFGIVEFEDNLRDGVVLARMAECLGAKGSIFEHPRLQWRHSDNIIMFLNFAKSPMVGLPTSFTFETIDLYEKKNLPKVIFCIHSLSHILANRGLVEKIGNLKGKLNFSEAQLQHASKGLNGQAMPNFANIGKDLAREMNVEPPKETEEEIQDRLLDEASSSIEALQAHAIGRLARLDYHDFLSTVHACSRSTSTLQAHLRGSLARVRFAKSLSARGSQLEPLVPTITLFQASASGALSRKRIDACRKQFAACDSSVKLLQAHLVGVQTRKGFHESKSTVRQQSQILRQFVARAQGALVRSRRATNASSLNQIDISSFIAHSKGVLARNRFYDQMDLLDAIDIAGFVAHARGALIRKTQIAKKNALSSVSISQGLVGFSAVARAKLARKQVQAVQADLTVVVPLISNFQSHAKALLVRRNHQQLASALANVSTVSSATGTQSILRAALSRARKGEQKKEVEFVLPNFVSFQAMARRAYQKGEYEWWRDHIRGADIVAVRLQSLLRGAIVRRDFYGRLSHFYRNTAAIVRLQAIWRGKGPREGFIGIRLGKNVKVSTVKNFGHLLDDNDSEVQDEARLKTLKINVSETYRETQTLEIEAEELDQSIGLFAKNIANLQSRGRSSLEIRPVPTFADQSASKEADYYSAMLLDPEAELKAEWARAKRLILAVLRIQPDKDILASLIAPVEDEHLDMWHEISQQNAHVLPPRPGEEPGYNLNDIKNLPYDEVKFQALSVCQQLEGEGIITRADGYQAILNSIAYDIRTKNRRQIQRTHELKSMEEIFQKLDTRKKDLEEQIEIYNAHNAQSISNLQSKSKRGSVIPLGKQYWHRRSLQQSGLMPRYGSWVYEAKVLYGRGLLLSVDQFSPTQYDRLELVFSSDTAGSFNIEILFSPPGHPKSTVGKSTVTMQDLLHKQREQKKSIALGLGEYNVNLLVAQLNKKFYKN
ncbi:iq domain-containing protein-containing [Phaffia rhodozyma]|uniref:Iq domain-containing protein-containing n=1 Tax=Phaffia rhodozyma TaxID=264483 RepID=A0A0F7SM90_PHARH|nr:iq domain-containing protein-containing [Phaffia rhodozyma]